MSYDKCHKTVKVTVLYLGQYSPKYLNKFHRRFSPVPLALESNTTSDWLNYMENNKEERSEELLVKMKLANRLKKMTYVNK